MNKTELIAAIAEKTELSRKDAEKALKAFTEVVEEELKKGEKIQLVGFGTFEVSERAAREGRNPQTGETMQIAASKSPKFKAGKALKAFIDVVSAELKKGEKVQLVGFGTFEVAERAAREGRNPQTGETMTIAASKNPKFKAGKALKDMVNA